MTKNDVQLENGYTRIANTILEVMATVKLSPTQHRVLYIVWRYTYGFGRKHHDLSLSFLTKATGCSFRQVQREVKSLLENKILIEVENKSRTRKIGFNKKFNEWTVDKDTIDNIDIDKSDNDKSDNDKTDKPIIDKSDKYKVDKTDNQERNNKEKYKEMLIDDFFEKIWKLLPKKKGKAKVSDKQKKILFNKVGEKDLVKAIKLFKEDMRGKDKQFIPYGSTFLNSGYVDYLEEAKRKEENLVKPTGKIKYITDEDIQEEIDQKHKEKIRKAEEVKKKITYYDG
ncbi:MAG: replication protein [Bacillota bacterium]|nr:replication protein [Bacillota bacterium]